MDTQNSLLIINTGGTFNKVYNKFKGNNEVAQNSNALNQILEYSYNIKYELKEIILKDSLEITKEDRQKICELIDEFNRRYVLIIHGTDTMDLACNFFDNYKFRTDKTILLTGSMEPYAFNPSEASFNFGVAIGFMQTKLAKLTKLTNLIHNQKQAFSNNTNNTNKQIKNKIYIAMGGIVLPYLNIKKNKQKAIFEIK